MSKRRFNIAEILESVDSIVTTKKYNNYNKKKIIDKYRQFSNKKIDMIFNRDTEKIIIDAENSQDNKKNNNISIESTFENYKKTLILDNEFIEGNENVTEENYLEEKIFSLEEKVLDENSTEETHLEEKVFPLKKEHTKGGDLAEGKQKNFIDASEELKEENLKQKEKIKDLNILLDSFISQKRYTELDDKIKLYQEDNAILRKKIFDLSDKETALRLQLTDLEISENYEKGKNKQFEQSSILKSENTNSLNEEILTLKKKNEYSENELIKIKDDKEFSKRNNDEKLKFYREENAKIIIDKNEILRKLENTKDQLSANENNKHELRLALDNLNQILVSSNIETRTFSSKSENSSPEYNTENPVKRNNERKEKIYKKSKTKLDDASLDYLIKEIFSK